MLQISCERYNHGYNSKHSKENLPILKVETPQLCEGELKQITIIFSSLEMTPGGSIAEIQGQNKKWSKNKSPSVKMQNDHPKVSGMYISQTIRELYITFILYYQQARL